ncbi:MAG TPA: hypothetical protein PK440_12305 [Candidatus Accumulibacter phosphatis]|nr:hypothetical protein [Candidatus Accumulibacter phosphatis]HRQ95762.1 hypothetical protein [Candidatus Accumulibacter phosphatis]
MTAIALSAADRAALAAVANAEAPPGTIVPDFDSTEMLFQWQRLNPTERYFSLLEFWWGFADIEQGRSALDGRMALYRQELLQGHRPDNRSNRMDNKQQEASFRLLGMKQIALMQLFGLLDIASEPPVPGKGWQARRMVATAWGLSASATYLEAFRCTSANLLARIFYPARQAPGAAAERGEDEMDGSPFVAWADLVNPFFPAWENSLGEPAPAEPFRGSVTFKVSLGARVWRRIVMPATSSFDDLARFILKAFEFDNEHLYQFRYQDEYAAQRRLNDPRYSDVEDDSADEVSLGEAGLFPRQVIVVDTSIWIDHRRRSNERLRRTGGALNDAAPTL